VLNSAGVTLYSPWVAACLSCITGLIRREASYANEKMGKLRPGSDTWITYGAGTQFDVPANSCFDLKVTEITDYCCSYVS
jgi:hypothetical protein